MSLTISGSVLTFTERKVRIRYIEKHTLLLLFSNSLVLVLVPALVPASALALLALVLVLGPTLVPAPDTSCS